MTCGNDVDLLAALLFKIPQEPDEILVTGFFSPKGQVAGDQQNIRFLCVGQIIKNSFVDALRFREALLLIFHKRLIFPAECAERVFEIMCVSDQKKLQWPHCVSPFCCADPRVTLSSACGSGRRRFCRRAAHPVPRRACRNRPPNPDTSGSYQDRYNRRRRPRLRPAGAKSAAG